MFSIIIFVLLVTGVTVNCEVHSLTYIYTALSKPAGLPGIHEFTAMGLLDNRMIEYFDSETQKKVPKQDWMKEKLNINYWEGGTEILKREQQRLRKQITIFMERMGQNDSDIHVLQRMHGCKADILPDGRRTSSSGMLMYNYDGNNVWSFNSISGVWVRNEAAGDAKVKWDDAPIINEKTEGLERDCLNRLDEFVSYEKLKAAPPPEVFMFTQKAKVETIVILTCLATGFYPKDIVLQIKRNGRVLTGEDGVVSSGVRPNGDDTNQQRDHVEILERDESVYTCEVKHNTLGLHVEKQWVRPPDVPKGAIIVTVVVVVVVLILVIPRMFVSLRRRAKHANIIQMLNKCLAEMKDQRARDDDIIQTLNKCLAEMKDANIIQMLNKCLAEMKGAADQRAQDANIIQMLNKCLAEMEDAKIIQMLNKCLAEMKDQRAQDAKIIQMLNKRLAEMNGAADQRARDAKIIQMLNKCLAEMKGAADQQCQDAKIIQMLNKCLTEMKGAADQRVRDANIIQTLNKCLTEMKGAADQRVRDDDIIQTLNKCLAEMKGAADQRARNDDIIQTLNKRLAEMEDQRARDANIIQMLNKCLAEMKDANNDETNTRLAEMKDANISNMVTTPLIVNNGAVNNDPTNIPLTEMEGSKLCLSSEDSVICREYLSTD